MRIFQFVRAAAQALAGNKLRSFLTMLGIIIGIAAIVIIIAVGNGAQSLIVNQISTFGSELIAILPGSSDDSGPPAQALGVTITSLKNDDLAAIKRRVAGVKAISGYVRGVATISWANESTDSQFVGVNADYFDVEDVDLYRGQSFSEEDDKLLRQDVVLGWTVYQDLFGDLDPVGQTIKIKRKSFRVIGVAEERGTEAFQNQDDQVFIPLVTAQKKMLGIDYVNLARAEVRDGEDIELVTEQVREVLRDEHKIDPGSIDDFSVRNTEQALSILTSVTDILKYFLAAISALSLFVGGIGIMNIMLVSVLERTREIGLRKAVGARPFDLSVQFLSETIIISFFGGLIGFIVGLLVSFGVSVAANTLGYYWEFRIGFIGVFLAFIFPIVTGLIFGFYPSQKASKLKPIDALRYE